MQKKTIRLGAGGTGLILAVLLSGCAALGPGHTDYTDMPGSGDHMAKGPGIFNLGQNQDYNGGYRVFSTEPGKKALFNPNAGHQAGSKTTGGNQAQTQTQSGSAENAAPKQRQQAFRQFQEYQQFKKFQHMPKNSPEYRKFREWQEWKQYQRWQNSGQNSGQNSN